MLYTIKAYKNTGFSPVNVPDSKDLVTTIGTPVTFDSVWLLQDLALQTVRVNAQWETVQDIDYVEVNGKFYFCTGVMMINENCAELVLSLDALTTIGIDNLVINSGWCTRRHVDDDTLFKNVIEEDWGPSEPYVMDSVVLESGDKSQNTYVCSTVSLSLDKNQRMADNYVVTPGETGDIPSVTVPRCPESDSPSSIGLNFDGSSGTPLVKEIPLTTLYLTADKSGDEIGKLVRESISILRSLGLENAITGCYAIPAVYVSDSDQYVETDCVRINRLTSNSFMLSGPAFKWSPTGYTVRNNKVFAGQFNKFRLASPVSGDSVDLDAHDIYIPGTTNSNFTLFADLAPGGRPYCRPTQFRGQSPSNSGAWYEQVISGGEWLTVPIAYNMASGSAITFAQAGIQAEQQRALLQVNREYADTEYQMNIARNNLGATMGMASGVMSIMSADRSNNGKGNDIGAAGGALSAVNAAATGVMNNMMNNFSYDRLMAQYNVDEMNISLTEYNTKAGTFVVPPEIRYPRTDAIQSFTGNNFQVVRYHLSDRDTEMYDRYLTMFGYRVSELLTIGCFSGRQYFNFVQGTNIDITPPTGTPMRVKMRAIEQLSQGVRVWHVKPSSKYFSNNPIV